MRGLTFTGRALGWSQMRLKNTVSSIKAGVWGEEPNGEDDLPVIRVADFDRNRLVAEQAPTLRAISMNEREGRLLESGDLLIEKSGGGDKTPAGTVVLYSMNVPAVCSNFLAAMKPAAGMLSRYLVYLHAALYSSGAIRVAIKQTTGIQNVDLEDYFDQQVALPGLVEQTGIANFLDTETGRISALIEEKQWLVALLAEKRRTVIADFLTKGLNKNAPRRDSGIPWLGEIPAHWNVRRAKVLFREIDDRSTMGDETLLSLRMEKGLVPHNDVSEKVIPSSELIGYKRARTGQIVVNRMRAASGLIAVVPQDGIVSPDYAVFEATGSVSPVYFALLFQTPLLQAVFRSESKGLGTGQSGFLRLYSENFLALHLPVPPFDEQQAIVVHAQIETKKLNALSEATERTITLLQERRSALISAAVTGELAIGEATL